MSLAPLSRRSVLRGLAVSGCAAIAGYLVARSSRAATTRGEATAANGYGPAPARGRLLARLDQVVSGGGLVLSGEKVVLTRGADDVVHGFSAVCTHQGCTVGSVVAGAIVCPCHGSRFDAQSGAVVAGPATRGLPPIPVVVRSDGVYTT